MNERSMQKIICGVQQVGIGVPNVSEIWTWYRKFFGMDVKIFEDEAQAPLMTQYTGNVVQTRTATLALSMEGGGGFEIWQYKSRKTEKANFEIQLGDYGLYACLIKSKNVEDSYKYFKDQGAELISNIVTRPNGKKTFMVKDPNGNIFSIVDGRSWFKNTKHLSRCGGVAGTIIGVSDIDTTLNLYKNVLDYETIEYDVEGVFEDLAHLPSGKGRFRRVLLSHKKSRVGAFAPLLGTTEIELIQSLDRTDCRKIFENRFWGDWGFIHLCFDIRNMDKLQEECNKYSFQFTVDSGKTFDMGEAGGRFAYIEDPDGTLIEFVETHKVPVVKKLGWYIHLNKRDPKKNLPKWMLSAMGMNRIKDK